MSKRSNQNSEAQRRRRLNGWDKIRALTGKPAPTEHERALRRARTARHKAKLAKLGKQPQRAVTAKRKEAA